MLERLFRRKPPEDPRIAQLLAEVGAMRQQTLVLTAELERARIRMEAADQATQQIREHTTRQQAYIDMLQRSAENATAEQVQLGTALAALQERNNDQAERLRVQRAITDAQAERIAHLDARITELTSERASLAQRVQVSEATADWLREENAHLRAAAAAAGVNLAAIDERMAERAIRRSA